MVFSSIPAYLDPSNWNQQQNHQIIGSSSANNSLPHPEPSQPHGGGGGGSIRPGSMAERARMANIPLPEKSLKCPRCESTNTKFCYFNNYNLSQPRHFCKTCRRYWTRGGALRNVPVGGGCRRNKRIKSSSTSKSPARKTNPTSTSAADSGLTPPQFPPLRFMSQITDNFAADLGLNYADLGGGSGIEPWRLQQAQQFPLLGGLDASTQGIHQFHGGELGFLGGGEMRPRFSSSMVSQRPPVKMEESRQILGGNEQWNAGPKADWREISSFSSSSTSNAL